VKKVEIWDSHTTLLAKDVEVIRVGDRSRGTIQIPDGLRRFAYVVPFIVAERRKPSGSVAELDNGAERFSASLSRNRSDPVFDSIRFRSLRLLL
jgi:hypothetical protein